MTGHRAIVEAGPGTIRRLCCGTESFGDEASEIIRAALDGLDDKFALVGERPVAVDALWSAALAAVTGAGHDGMVVLHPSWWSSTRVATVTAAAATVTDDVAGHPRSWLLKQASPAEPEATAVVEIAERLVAVTGAEAIAIPRGAEPQRVADEAAGVIAGMEPAAVVIDAPSSVAGASTLATSIAGAVRPGGQVVVHIDDARLMRLARSTLSVRGEPPEPRPATRDRSRALSGLGAAAAVVAAMVPGVVTVGRHNPAPAARVESAPTTFLVEGRVAVSVPANWPTQRVVSGPGSARVQITSPSDPEVALHVTQSPVAGETLSGSAERLRRAIDEEPAGVFVDFNPSGTSAGRPAVTYREVRPGHHVRWAVLLDGPVRISIGCQSRPGADDAIRGACEQAVRSAHAIG